MVNLSNNQQKPKLKNYFFYENLSKEIYPLINGTSSKRL